MGINLRYLTDPAPADLFRKGPSVKRQASSLTGDKLDDIGIYRRNYENK